MSSGVSCFLFFSLIIVGAKASCALNGGLTQTSSWGNGAHYEVTIFSSDPADQTTVYVTLTGISGYSNLQNAALYSTTGSGASQQWTFSVTGTVYAGQSSNNVGFNLNGAGPYNPGVYSVCCSAPSGSSCATAASTTTGSGSSPTSTSTSGTSTSTSGTSSSSSTGTPSCSIVVSIAARPGSSYVCNDLTYTTYDITIVNNGATPVSSIGLTLGPIGSIGSQWNLVTQSTSGTTYTFSFTGGNSGQINGGATDTSCGIISSTAPSVVSYTVGGTSCGGGPQYGGNNPGPLLIKTTPFAFLDSIKQTPPIYHFDGSPNFYWNDTNTVQMYMANQFDYQMKSSSSPLTIASTGPNYVALNGLGPTYNPSDFDSCGCWLEGIGQYTNGTYWVIYHAENRSPYDPYCTYTQGGESNKSLGLATSQDGINWQKKGQIISAYNLNIDKAGDASVFTSEYYPGYIFVLFLEAWTPSLAYASLSCGLLPGCWYKYYNGGFTQPGLRGQATPLANTWAGTYQVAQIRLQGKVYLMATTSFTTGIFLWFADPRTPWNWQIWPYPLFLTKGGYGANSSEPLSQPVLTYLTSNGLIGNQRIIEEGETVAAIYSLTDAFPGGRNEEDSVDNVFVYQNISISFNSGSNNATMTAAHVQSFQSGSNTYYLNTQTYTTYTPVTDQIMGYTSSSTLYMPFFLITQRIHAYPRISTHIHAYPRISTHIHAYPRISTHIHAYPRISTHIHAYPRVSTHIPRASCINHAYISRIYIPHISRIYHAYTMHILRNFSNIFFLPFGRPNTQLVMACVILDSGNIHVTTAMAVPTPAQYWNDVWCPITCIGQNFLGYYFTSSAAGRTPVYNCSYTRAHKYYYLTTDNTCNGNGSPHNTYYVNSSN